jgi:hypothetical protein
LFDYIYITTDSIKPEKPPLDFHIPPWKNIDLFMFIYSINLHQLLVCYTPLVFKFFIALECFKFVYILVRLLVTFVFVTLLRLCKKFSHLFRKFYNKWHFNWSYCNNFMGWNIIYITTDSIKPEKNTIRFSHSTMKEYWPVHIIWINLLISNQ